MDKEFELSRRERFDALLMRKDDLAKSNDYYHKIHPIEAAAVDKNLTDAIAAAEAKKKTAAEAAAKAAAAKAAAAKATQQPSTPRPPGDAATEPSGSPSAAGEASVTTHPAATAATPATPATSNEAAPSRGS
jgi:septal ring factor EnvC (AmiA/AmiB activator)